MIQRIASAGLVFVMAAFPLIAKKPPARRPTAKEISEVCAIRAHIAKWRGDHAAAVSIAYDDGNPASPLNRRVNQEVMQRRMSMDYELVTADYLQSPFLRRYLLKNLVPAGIGYFGHGHLHVNHDALSFEAAVQSFENCRRTMESFGLRPVAYAYPNGAGHKRETQAAVEKAGFLSARLHFCEQMTEPWIIPGAKTEPENWFALPTLVMQDYNFTHCKRCVGSNEQLLPRLERALAENAWIILTYHAIGDEKGYGYYSMDEFIKDLDAIRERDFWNASMNDVTLYVRERARARVDMEPPFSGEPWTDGAGIRLSDGLANDVYNYPLTVVVELPPSWIGHPVALMENGRAIARFIPETIRLLIELPPDELKRLLIPEPADGLERVRSF